MLMLEKINSLDGFMALRGEWEALLARCSYRTPFLTHDWMILWWKYFGEGKELCILVLREHGRAVAIAPLMCGKGWLRKRHFRAPLRLMETMANYHSNRTDFICAEYKDEYLACLWNYLVNEERWHGLRLSPLSAASPMLATLRRFTEREGLSSVFTNIGGSPYLPMPDDWAGYCRTRSTYLKRKIRKAERLQADGEFQVEFFRTEARLDDVLQDVFEISEAGWAAKDGTAISSTTRLRGFYRDLARVASKRGWLDMSLLKAAGKPIAFEYNLFFDRTVYNLKLGFDEKFARYNPGHALKYFLLTEINQHRPDIRGYDLLGNVDAYKLLWTKQVCPLFTAFVYHPRSVYAQSLYRIQSRFLIPLKRRLARVGQPV